MGVAVTVIRLFTTDDVAPAVSLEEASQPKPWTQEIFNDELVAENRTYLAVDDDGLVGFGGIMVVGDEAHITNLLVSPDHRGRGIGRLLMADLIRSAVEQGARHLTLEVRSKNAAARALYTRFGLAPVGVRKDYYGDDDALVMWAHDIDEPGYLGSLP